MKSFYQSHWILTILIFLPLLGAQAGSDVNSYKVVHKTTTEFGPAGRYLVNDQGAPVYLADPGIKVGIRSPLNSILTKPEVGAARVLFHQDRRTPIGKGLAVTDEPGFYVGADCARVVRMRIRPDCRHARGQQIVGKLRDEAATVSASDQFGRADT